MINNKKIGTAYMKPNLQTPFIVWFTSPRTMDIFYSEVKKNSRIEIYNPRIPDSNRIQKFISLFFMMKSKHCKGILVDNSGGAITLLIIILSKLFNVPIFMRLRGGMSGEFFDKLGIKNRCLRYLSAVWEKFKRRLLLYNSNKILTVSIFAKSQVLYELPGIELNRLKVLYKPVDFEAIDSAEKGQFRKVLNIGKCQKILLTATNFNYKRKYEALIYYHDVILKALQENPDWVYVILGGGAGLEVFKKIIKQKTPETLSNRIFITGYYPRIYEALIDADLFVYMSYRDAAPQVVKEAQAAFLPVISNYSCFGSNEFIPNNYNGINILFEEPEELFLLLEKLFQSDPLRKKLEMINRKHAEKYYHPKDAAQKFVNEALG